jgi:hypothetical protein
MVSIDRTGHTGSIGNLISFWVACVCGGGGGHPHMF